MAELTDEQIKQEEQFMKGLPRFNVGAFVLPPIWGPAHGFWVTILYYPAWLFADNMFFGAYIDPTPINIILAASLFVILLAVTIAFAIVSQPIAAHRAEERGVSRSQYLRRERMWAIGCIAGGIVMLVLATIYNLGFRVEV